ncbi:MAG TPA: 16S rRNA (adenine(1518)-N(6)/adenine(1519)-N(6))-dimethyltransferase RsmA [Hyphomicrobiaceae bacterium]|nr:16S rRNA (adenine(1518)-N(6)/adenine(1519)-N(6))-dimethyltransferase RsmA [Hyphomicrobiaceae bacterium]
MTASTEPRQGAGKSPDGLPPLAEVIARYGLQASRNLGQNFILDLNLTRAIARAAGPLSRAAVIEVGPGPGGLTRALLLEGAARVIAIERDARCLPALAEIAARYPGRLEVVAGNALKVDWAALVRRCPHPVRIIANLPYNVATKLLTGWLESEPWPPWFERMTLMFQREVAERIVAKPGSKSYGRLAVISQWRTRPRIVMTLGPAAFVPPPKVQSALVDFQPRPRPDPPCSAKALSEVTAAAFGQRRKMLRSSLKRLVAEPEALLAAAGLDPALRAEQVSIRDLARLALVLERCPAGKR